MREHICKCDAKRFLGTGCGILSQIHTSNVGQFIAHFDLPLKVWLICYIKNDIFFSLFFSIKIFHDIFIIWFIPQRYSDREEMSLLVDNLIYHNFHAMAAFFFSRSEKVILKIYSWKLGTIRLSLWSQKRVSWASRTSLQTFFFP